jgi:hypothetical protein
MPSLKHSVPCRLVGIKCILSKLDSDQAAMAVFAPHSPFVMEAFAARLDRRIDPPVLKGTESLMVPSLMRMDRANSRIGLVAKG